MKQTAKTVGNFGEDIAERYLKSKGWRILSRNFSASGGEIDIIGFKRGNLVFFEVKTRSNSRFGLPSDAVDGNKISRIQKTAWKFLRTYSSGNKIPVFYPMGIEIKREIRQKRIDVIEVYLSPDKRVEKINHLKDWGKEL